MPTHWRPDYFLQTTIKLAESWTAASNVPIGFDCGQDLLISRIEEIRFTSGSFDIAAKRKRLKKLLHDLDLIIHQR